MRQVYEAYIDKQALEKAHAHCTSAASKGMEAIGLLVGTAGIWKGVAYAHVDEYITSGNSATRISVKFDPDDFPQLASGVNKARREGKIIVGWAHAHPDFGCFLSSTDVSTQKKYFSEQFSIALVIDPVRAEKQVFKLSNDAREYRTATYAIVSPKRGY